MMKKILVTGFSILAAGLFATVFLASKPHPALAGTTAAITSNAITKTQMKNIEPMGVQMMDKGSSAPRVSNAALRSINNSPNPTFISPRTAANRLLSDFMGSSTNVRFVVASRSNGNNGYESFNSNITSGDPHFKDTHNKFKNIPCYFVTVSGVKGIVSAGPRGAAPIVHTSVSALIDATNGKPLLIYSVAKG